MSAYRQLEARFRRIATIEQAISVLHWDAAAMMPPGGAAARAEQLATLRGIVHSELIAPDLAELADRAGAEHNALDVWQAANLREIRRRLDHAAALPCELVEAVSRASSECETVWRGARAAGDFASVLPQLEGVLRLKREVAAAKAERLGTSPYEALLDQYEPGGSVAMIDRLFDEISTFLPDLIEAAMTRQAARPPLPEPEGPFPIDAQRGEGV
jgi:carboxypeptidase Taq